MLYYRVFRAPFTGNSWNTPSSLFSKMMFYESTSPRVRVHESTVWSTSPRVPRGPLQVPRVHESPRVPRSHESASPRVHESTSPRALNPRVHEILNLSRFYKLVIDCSSNALRPGDNTKVQLVPLVSSTTSTIPPSLSLSTHTVIIRPRQCFPLYRPRSFPICGSRHRTVFS
jgi:hypothetical protein